jgi:hypothetical protein
MGFSARVARGAEAGAITAGAIEVSFFLLDLVRLRPLATPATLSGAGVSPGAPSLDLTNVSGMVEALWATYQISMLTLAHFIAFAVAGIVASFAFDWSRSGGIRRFGVLAAICLVALLATVAFSSSVVALGSVGVWIVLGMVLFSPAILGSILRVLSMPDGHPGRAVGRA